MGRNNHKPATQPTLTPGLTGFHRSRWIVRHRGCDPGARQRAWDTLALQVLSRPANLAGSQSG